MSEFKIGDKVRVKASVTHPYYSWGAVKPGDVGVVQGYYGEEMMEVRFPNQSDWTAKPYQMELVVEEKEAAVVSSMLKLEQAIKDQIEAIRKSKARFRDEQRKLSKLQAAQTLINSL